ncbi:unnamed protein product [Ambrosiozyma monospora]|uniref:Unnamed protein product n=1 Tax=Ambrosiozyma monospora TaxID=43982 RepID=A0ACB5TRZ1_AMBMO|nr:unnamed protein product [Ambrosiozyma monospora]
MNTSNSVNTTNTNTATNSLMSMSNESSEDQFQSAYEGESELESLSNNNELDLDDNEQQPLTTLKNDPTKQQQQQHELESTVTPQPTSTGESVKADFTSAGTKAPEPVNEIKTATNVAASANEGDEDEEGETTIQQLDEPFKVNETSAHYDDHEHDADKTDDESSLVNGVNGAIHQRQATLTDLPPVSTPTISEDVIDDAKTPVVATIQEKEEQKTKQGGGEKSTAGSASLPSTSVPLAPMGFYKFQQQQQHFQEIIPDS